VSRAGIVALMKYRVEELKLIDSDGEEIQNKVEELVYMLSLIEDC
jgi:hypothetical protein